MLTLILHVVKTGMPHGHSTLIIILINMTRPIADAFSSCLEESFFETCMSNDRVNIQW